MPSKNKRLNTTASKYRAAVQKGKPTKLKIALDQKLFAHRTNLNQEAAGAGRGRMSKGLNKVNNKDK